jgi:NADPH-dependent 7-cyano-7-deazaguanine reductase QueF
LDEKQKKFVEFVRNDLQLNEKNLSRYIYSFSHRNDFTHELKERMQKFVYQIFKLLKTSKIANKILPLFSIETVLVTGGKSSHNDVNEYSKH